MSGSFLRWLIRKLNVDIFFVNSMYYDCMCLCIKGLCNCDAMILMQLITTYHWPSISTSRLNGLIRFLTYFPYPFTFFYQITISCITLSFKGFSTVTGYNPVANVHSLHLAEQQKSAIPFQDCLSFINFQKYRP